MAVLLTCRLNEYLFRRSDDLASDVILSLSQFDPALRFGQIHSPA